MNLTRKTARHASADQLAFVFMDAPPVQSPRAAEQREAPRPTARARITDAASTAPTPPTKRAARTKKPARPSPLGVGLEERRLTVEEAAEILSISVKTLEAWRRFGKGPVFVKLGRSVRYTMHALDQFTRDRTVRNSAEGRMLDARR